MTNSIKQTGRPASEDVLMQGEGESRNKFAALLSIRPHLDIFIGVILLTAVLKVLHLYFESVFDLANIALLYLIPVLYGVIRWGRAATVSSAILSVIAFDYFFVPPVLSFSVADLRYLITFIIFCIIAFVTGDLASRLKDEARTARKREERTAALYALSRKMAAETDLQHLQDTIVQVIAQTIDGDAVILMPDVTGIPQIVAATTTEGVLVEESKEASADWLGKSVFIPLRTKDKTLGMIGVLPKQPERTLSGGQRQLLEAFSNLSAVAIVRLQLAAEAHKIRHIAASEKLRTALFNSVSHDLRTPLASITGAVTSLQEEGIYNSEARRALVETIKDGALRMNHMVGNILDSARLESGMLTLNKDWCDIQDIIGVALAQAQDVVRDRSIRVEIPTELPLVQADFSLIEQVIINLLYNAVNYSPQGSEISITVTPGDNDLIVAIGDRGSGIAEADKDRVFDKFYRLYSSEHVRGTGLGLSICKGLIEVHEGSIWVDVAPEGGSIFTFTLPLDSQPTVIEPITKEGVEDF
ncbi:MAG TPA: ATP-binding protein [Candidatus Aquicultor sp.]|jgi:two-component system sensor histidine kinase KdpD